MTDPDLRRMVEELKAIEDIKRLKAHYCQHCDRDYDPDALAALFTEDAVWDAGPLRGLHTGRQAIGAFFAGAATMIPYAAHLVTNPLIEVDLDAGTATGQWRMLMPCTLRNAGGSQAAFQVADYDEAYRLVDGEWLFARLKVRLQRLPIPAAQWIDLSAGGETAKPPGTPA